MSRIYIERNLNSYFWNEENRLWSEVYDEQFSAGRNPEEYENSISKLEENIRMLREELIINLEKEKLKYKMLYEKQKRQKI